MRGKSEKELYKIISQLKKGPLEDKLIKYFNGNNFDDAPVIDIYSLADQWQEERREILDAFLQLVSLGLCELNWSFHCPQCGGIAHESLSLKNAHEEDHCGLCTIDFKNNLDRNVEVQFSIHRGFIKKNDSIKEAKEKLMMKTIQNKGKVQWITNTTVLGSDCIHHPGFREFLGSDLLDLTQTLAVHQGTMLFTDIKGSTALYEKLGDPRAYRLVRDHFNILFHETELNGGAVVKTIGDAVMCSFPEPLPALRTALAMQQEIYQFNQDQDDEVEIKIGIHSGPVIVVTLNNRLDYFGSTVNKAARIQGEAQAGEILVSEEIFTSQLIKDELIKHVPKVLKRKVQLRGMEKLSNLYRIPRVQ